MAVAWTKEKSLSFGPQCLQPRQLQVAASSFNSREMQKNQISFKMNRCEIYDYWSSKRVVL